MLITTMSFQLFEHVRRDTSRFVLMSLQRTSIPSVMTMDQENQLTIQLILYSHVLKTLTLNKFFYFKIYDYI